MTTESLSYRVQRRLSYSVTAALDRLFGEYIDGHYPEWRTETALRYFPIAKDLEGQAISELKMLDVGSGASGIKPYLQVEPQLLVGLDSDFSKDSDRFLIRDLVISQGERLPFADHAFEIVICLDVLEHVQLENRIALIKEVLRVASKTVYIGFPTGKGARRQDVRLDRAFVARYGARHYFLVEHLSHALPSKRDLEAALLQSSITPKQIKRYSNQNLLMREWLMLWAFVSNSHFTSYFGRRLSLLFFPLLSRINLGRCYRQIFKIEL